MLLDMKAFYRALQGPPPGSPPGRRLFDLREIAVLLGGQDSPAYFAADALFRIHVIRVASAHGNFRLAQLQAFNLGKTVAQWSMKQQWESVALSGVKRRETLSAARDRKNKLEAERASLWQSWARTRASEIWSRHPHLSTSAVARHIQKLASDSAPAGTDPSDFPKGDRSFRAAISDLKPKKVGKPG